jgi:hypothetical protein
MGASDSRTLLGTTDLKTLPGKCLRTSSATSAESRVRASYMVSSTPNSSRLGLSIRRSKSSVLRSGPSPSSA